ncbi:hypothetical protein KXW98_008599 [Aspergillus fumigatus]|uniref:Uncharacterized protein n=1 Tax=Aspergillus fumigatus TaxID=746128 RepID=A0A9P8NKU8_ASPFM|nr:hypothetical protein KXX30_009195 [Aspergillus fumigatus]KAH1320277.1 hypothetical protein KXX38_009475 [Aspergillus fumigatus]KAH1354757.1 hypothetical protein KXX33_007871 [Aspergillus fumigatus]KAH1360358.1 hypothetical protein KXX14_008450 [Aspergillus fumigatus]KAH1397718.1 hypothetical protein KXX49_005874 [Aspergillus fumigatus]
MAQGPLKKTKPSTAKRPTALAPKRGPRQIAPKKATLIKQQKITKLVEAYGWVDGEDGEDFGAEGGTS